MSALAPLSAPGRRFPDTSTAVHPPAPSSASGAGGVIQLPARARLRRQDRIPRPYESGGDADPGTGVTGPQPSLRPVTLPGPGRRPCPNPAVAAPLSFPRGKGGHPAPTTPQLAGASAPVLFS